MNTKILEYLIAIADEKSVTKAAAQFYLSQPSLSQHLSNVEKQIGFKLFYRSGGELHLTEAGTIFINGARAILSVEQHAMSQIAAIEPVTEHSQV